MKVHRVRPAKYLSERALMYRFEVNKVVSGQLFIVVRSMGQWQNHACFRAGLCAVRNGQKQQFALLGRLQIQ